MYARARDDLDLLLTRFHLVQRHYDWARSRGDPERVLRFGMQLRAITAERERLMRHLSEGTPDDESRSELVPCRSAMTSE